MPGSFKDYDVLLKKRLVHFHKIVFDFRLKRQALVNKNRPLSKYKIGDLVYLINSLTSQYRTASQNLMFCVLDP